MDKNREDIRHIRLMMERSTKFLSVSGLAGIGAGLTAVVGAYFAKEILFQRLSFLGDTTLDLLLVALATIALAGFCGLYFSIRKAKKNNSKFWMPVTIQIVKDFAIPMLVGGALCATMVFHHQYIFIPATMLIFYGLALISAGARTYHDIKLLGICQIALGILAAIFIQNGLLFWAIGFGALHILYGVVMYWRYERKPDKESTL